MVEGHIAARRAAKMEGGTLHTITIEGIQLTRKERETVTRTHPPLPPLADPPPALPALTNIVGLMPVHQGLADRRWRVPSLAVVQQEGWDADTLGRFISTSSSLRRVFVGGSSSFDEGGWAGVFEGIPETPPGQQGGPLSQLEAIGTIKIRGNSTDQLGVERLQAVLLARGCRRSLQRLDVSCDLFDAGRRTFPVLLAVDRLATECCRQDAPVTFTSPGSPVCTYFDLNMFHHSEIPTHPSPWLKSVIQQLARQVTQVQYSLTQDDLTDDLRNPSESAIDIANTLTFDEAGSVEVRNAYDFDPPANADSPHPSIIAHLPQQPFPKATHLWIGSRLGGAAGRLLAAKMPDKVGGVDTRWGGEDELVGAAGGLPKIKDLWIIMKLPDGAGEEDVGSHVYARLSSLIDHVRGLQHVRLDVDPTTPQQHDSILDSLPEGTNIRGFTITRVDLLTRGAAIVVAVRNG
ncbi:unnamed protein product [Vitrella brassicaformis CCMP3155]|uniref:Uncharacterized protein n=1 Tax=Vitrella brassicaformis (strain CCMP3155) TaxID=1169540 RepID=A0A0G4GRD1_VITBC|nr:unnamed protein product [Vitrella brassicaformis CCMP3155]|eukprot:CEM33089.1 unnamed protein product [Vitrella brassicaformis CCMP3155]